MSKNHVEVKHSLATVEEGLHNSYNVCKAVCMESKNFKRIITEQNIRAITERTVSIQLHSALIRLFTVMENC